MKINCVIIDDELPARKLLQRYIGQIPYLQLTASFHSALQAMDSLQANPPDLIFLDIEMPGLNGIQFLKTNPNPDPKVIIVTAYPQYAIEGFELSVTDYLIKPFSFERFLHAVQKVNVQLINERKLNTGSSNSISIKVDRKLYRIPCEEILYLQAYGDYVRIFRKNGKTLTTKERLGYLLSILPPEDFLKTHRSYVARLKSIEYLDGNQIKIGEHFIPVSSQYKQSLINLL